MGAITRPQPSYLPVQLANEPSLRVGKLAADPPTRQVSDGVRDETLEPRVMQALVALAGAKARVISRDELVDRCWEGRAISEDAIHRVIARLRQLAADIGAHSFRIETIRGVGYRLVDGSDERGGEAILSRRAIIAGSAAAAATAAIGAWWAFGGREHQPVPLAVQYYQRGLNTRGQASIELAEQGAAFFREATRIDPQFAAAWGALAWSYRGLPEYGDRPDAARLRSLCLSAAAHALKLDPDNSDAQAALLLLKPFYGNWAPIERGLHDLIQRHPQNSILEYNLAFTLNQVGRWRESVPLFRAVSNREQFWPLPHLRLILALYESGNGEEADDLIDEGMKRFPRRIDYWFWQMRHLIIAGRIPEAIAFANDISRRPAVGDEPVVDFEVGTARALADGSDSARRSALDRIIARVRQQPGYAPWAACSACLLGFPDQSLSILDGYYFDRGAWAAARGQRPITELLFTGSMALLRTHPGFPQLLRETGLEDYWRTTGTLPDYRHAS